MRERHDGLLVGGPKAGQYMAGESMFLVVLADPRPSPVSAIADNNRSQLVVERRSTYRHITLMGMPLWVLDTILADGPEAVIRELANGYRPKLP